MRILVTGANGYVGGRLVPRLLAAGHSVRAMVRDASRLEGFPWRDDVEVVVGNVQEPDSLQGCAEGMDAAYYLVHGMVESKDFRVRDREAASHFANAVAGIPHVIYLGGLQPTGTASNHLASRAEVGAALAAVAPTTELRAGPVIGSGSASFEMTRYLTERLPVMLVPRWVDNAIQPVAIRDVLAYLVAALDKGPQGIVDIGGEVRSFRSMMQGYAEVRGLRRRIIKVPVLAPTLAARWVQFITPITNRLAVPLLAGIVHPVTADTAKARQLFPEIDPIAYEEAVRLALRREELDDVETRWTRQVGPGYMLTDWENMKQERRTVMVAAEPAAVHAFLCSLGGKRGWLAWNAAWKLRGAMDRLVGGPGLRRGRRNRNSVRVGDAVDFWRVEAVEPGRLLRLRAEMKVPGKAWLQFECIPSGEHTQLVQTAFFEPKGLAGVLYWSSLYPIHRIIFRDMTRAIRRHFA